MDNKAKLQAAQRLIRVATGEPYGDGITVTDLGIGYAEPGYHDDDTPWVLGDWNNKTRWDDGKRVETSNVPGRLFDALERLGVQGEWCDEWTQCSNCYRIVRTTGDCYQWQRFYVELPDGDTLCGNCALDPDWTDEVFDQYVNHPDRVITWCPESHLESLSWTRYNQDQYQAGWHPGMDASPSAILAAIQDTMPDVDVVFWLDENSQFYSEFSAFTRPVTTDDDEEEES